MAKITGGTHEGSVSKTVTNSDVIRRAAPELIENNTSPATASSDTYSFAMLILECITEDVPFYEIPHDTVVIHTRINKKQCPPRPDGKHERRRISDDLWELMNNCWAFKAKDRPTMERVHRFFLHGA